jgi:pimeloyl-ACP methyl ester carboxylesterase
MALFFQESGLYNASTIVFLHGGGGAGWMWQPQVERLENEYHCLVPDLPEQGRSTDEKPFTIQGSAEQIAWLIRSNAHGGSAHVVGLSEGAQVTVALLAIAPELVESAVISSALLRPIPGAGLLSPGLVRLAYRWTVTPFKNNDWWIRTNMKYAAGVPEKYHPQFRQSFQSLTEDGFTNMMIENQRFRLPPGLERVQTPALIVVGKKEYAAMHRSAIDLAAVLPAAKAYRVVHKKNLSLAEEHNWNINAPELFTRMVRAWMTGRSLPEELQPV